MWCRRSRGLPYLNRFRTVESRTKRVYNGGAISERMLAAQNAVGSGRPDDYSTVERAENEAFPSLAGTARQAWLKLTSHRAFVTITSGLETEFPG